MKIIAIQEHDIKAILDKLKLTKMELQERYKPEYYDMANTMQREFHYNLVKFFQDQGSNFPRE